jgi:hypothetical protein
VIAYNIEQVRISSIIIVARILAINQFETLKLSSVHCKTMFEKKGLHYYATVILSCAFTFILQTSMANADSYYTIQETVTNIHKSNNFNRRHYPNAVERKNFQTSNFFLCKSCFWCASSIISEVESFQCPSCNNRVIFSRPLSDDHKTETSL